jgi:hypothetical protein
MLPLITVSTPPKGHIFFKKISNFPTDKSNCINPRPEDLIVKKSTSLALQFSCASIVTEKKHQKKYFSEV